ncbi:class I SAM-dependent methyltransferase [Spirochaeta dissipatitropha]
MYDLIAQEYSSIFPLDPDRLRMVEALVPERSPVLDIGCASGDFPAALAAAGYNAEGWEPDPSLFQTAVSRHGADHLPKSALQFFRKGMLDLSARQKYSLITCLGNTLPHLRDTGEISGFLERAERALIPGGWLALQLLNYRIILDQGEKTFPDIGTDSIVFRRRYQNISEEGIDFEIEIEDKARGTVHSDSSRLFPLSDRQLFTLLESSGFRNLQSSRNYQLEAALGNEAFFIVTARSKFC